MGTNRKNMKSAKTFPSDFTSNLIWFSKTKNDQSFALLICYERCNPYKLLTSYFKRNIS